MSAIFLKRGNTFRVTSKESLDSYELLPALTYALRSNPMTGLYLEVIDNFELPSKIYGDYKKDANRLLSTFEARKGTTGVLLAGEKGSGKTLLSKLTANMGLERGYPVIVINDAYCGEQFNTFIQDIEQRAILVFDEFEKVYPKESQEQILTLLDGVFSSTKLFIFTSNDKYKIDIHMQNRPGRIFYMLDFYGLDEAFVKEYCEERLNNKTHIRSVLNTKMLFDAFNFDMLQALVEEMNRYNESASQALRYLNIKPSGTANTTFEVKLFVDDKEVPKGRLDEETIFTSPLVKRFAIDYHTEDMTDEYAQKLSNGDIEMESAIFNPDDIIHIEDNKFVLKNDNITVILTKVVEKERFDYKKYL